MSDAFSSSSRPLSSSGHDELKNNIPQAFSSLNTDASTSSIGSSSAGPSTWHVADPSIPHASLPLFKSLINKKTQSIEEWSATEETRARFIARLASDHALVLHPDVDTPFQDAIDVLDRLLPYHVFQHNKDDLEVLIKGGKGKGKATEQDLRKDIEETKFALECHRRRCALDARFRRVQTRSGKRAAPDGQAVLLASLLLDDERAETTSLNNNLRTARVELERREKEKRAAANTPRSPYYATASGAVPAQYYRGYPYTYTQLYGAHPQLGTTSAYSVPLSTPLPNKTAINTAIPIQLPVASLPALHALGIIPMPATSLPPSDQPQPPAVLRGSSSNGTMLSLEINVSLLQPAQMSGLATMLNSLMSRSNPVSNASAPLVEPTATSDGDSTMG